MSVVLTMTSFLVGERCRRVNVHGGHFGAHVGPSFGSIARPIRARRSSPDGALRFSLLPVRLKATSLTRLSWGQQACLAIIGQIPNSNGSYLTGSQVAAISAQVHRIDLMTIRYAPPNQFPPIAKVD